MLATGPRSALQLGNDARRYRTHARSPDRDKLIAAPLPVQNRHRDLVRARERVCGARTQEKPHDPMTSCYILLCLRCCLGRAHQPQSQALFLAAARRNRNHPCERRQSRRQKQSPNPAFDPDPDAIPAHRARWAARTPARQTRAPGRILVSRSGVWRNFSSLLTRLQPQAVVDRAESRLHRKGQSRISHGRKEAVANAVSLSGACFYPSSAALPV